MSDFESARMHDRRQRRTEMVHRFTNMNMMTKRKRWKGKKKGKM